MTPLIDLYEKMASCNACKVRKECLQVVPGTGCYDKPILMIIGDMPSKDDDKNGEPFVGQAGEVLREILRKTCISPSNTLLTNVLKCTTSNTKFPTGDPAEVCVSQWLWKEIEISQPQRMLLLGGAPLKYIAGMKGITENRGKWFKIRGIRTMPTFHPNYILRNDREGVNIYRELWERDVQEVASEVERILYEH